MFGKKGNIFSKAAAWLGGGLLGMIAALPFAMYIPWVQNKVADIACDIASEKTGMDISVGDVDIDFPLDATVKDVQVIDENGDTLFRADEVKADIAPKPLINKKVEANNVSLKGAKSQVKTEDGSVDLDVDLKEGKIDAAKVDLNNNKVDVNNAHLKGGKAKMSYKADKKKPDPKKEPSKPWKVDVKDVKVDDLDYKMDMKPTFDNLDAKVKHAEGKNVKVDTGAKTVDVGSLEMDEADVKYEYPSEKDAKEYSKNHPLPEEEPSDGEDDGPWTVKADKLRLNNSKGKYAQTGKPAPKPGGDLDTDYIEVEDANIAVDNFESKGDDLTVPVKNISGKERSGLQIKDGSGTVNMNDKGLDLNDVKLKTKGSDIKLDAHVDQDMLDGKPNGKANINTDSKIDLKEAEKIAPDLRETLKDIPHNKPVKVKGKARANDKRVDIQSLDADIPGLGRVKGKGTVYNPTDMDRMKLDVDTEVDLRNADPLNKMLGLNNDMKLQPMKLSGKVNKDGCKYTARNLRISSGGGTLSGNGYYDMCNENYDVDASFNNFPVKSFMPSIDATGLTGSIDAQGHGFDFMDCGSTWTDATVNLKHVNYNGTSYDNLRARGKLRSGYVDAFATSANPGCDLDVDAHGTICDDHYVFTADGNVRDLDLNRLGMYDGQCQGKTMLHADGDINLRTHVWDVDMTLNDLDWMLDSNALIADDAHGVLLSTPDRTCITVENEDNYIHLNSPSGMMALVEDFQNTAKEIQRQYQERRIDVEKLKEPMPWFDMDMHMGTDGIVQRYLMQHDMDFRNVSCEMSRDSSLFLDGRAYGISYGETNIDTVTIHANELQNEYLAFNAHMGNRPGTWDEFATVDLEGGIKGDALDMLLHQQNIKGETGYHLGFNAHLVDNVVKTRLFGDNPVIGYRDWTINDDNYVNLDYRTRMIDANLHLKSDSSSVELYTSRLHNDSTENVQLNIENLRLEEWTQIVPMLGNTSGILNANVDMNWDGANADGDATVDIRDFIYKGKDEGDLTVDADFELDPLTATTHLSASMIFDGERSVSIEGALNDANSSSPLNVTAEIEKFPLSRANPFIPGDYIWLDGYADGNVQVTGSMDSPIIQGRLVSESGVINLPKYGMSLNLSTMPIELNQNHITFKDYKLLGANQSPVFINGYVDMKDLDNMIIDLDVKGHEVQFMDSQQDDFTQMFGKGFANFDATVNSKANVMTVRANATLLPGSNITYVMKDDISQLSNKVDQDMVTFTDFRGIGNSNNILKTASGSSALNILANITAQQGAKINVFISDDGQSRATIDGNGRLKYTLDFAGRDNLTGSYIIESGNLRYTPPLISQKNFTIDPGSSITWTGEMLNPQLKLEGEQKAKATVSSEDEGSRVVDFIIDANVGGTLNNIDLKFDLTSENDMTVQNELQTMSDIQRSQAAINMLLYNTYSGSNSAGNIKGITATSALFSFLQSKLNSWVAETLPGFDLSFGINQYEGTKTGSIQTSYSYRLAKSLFNDRFKIVVGGEYNTDVTNQQDIANQLFSDVSLEYYLNDNASRYLKLFHHSNYENVLEGQVIETGVAYVFKHKLTNLKNLFTFRHSREYLLRDSLEKARKAELKLQEQALDAIGNNEQTTFTVPLDDATTDPQAIDKPTVNRKEDENNE